MELNEDQIEAVKHHLQLVNFAATPMKRSATKDLNTYFTIYGFDTKEVRKQVDKSIKAWAERDRKKGQTASRESKVSYMILELLDEVDKVVLKL